MASKTLKTRIIHRYVEWANWTTEKTIVPMKGEVVIINIPASSNQYASEPAVIVKVGDGATTLESLPSISALAADVHSWAKAASKPTYNAGEVSATTPSGFTGATVQALINELASKVGGTDVGQQIADAIAEALETYYTKEEADEKFALKTDLNTIGNVAQGASDLATENKGRLDTLTGTGAGSVAKSISDEIAKLDGTVTGTGNFVKTISQTDGKVTATLGGIAVADVPDLTLTKITDAGTAAAKAAAVTDIAENSTDESLVNAKQVAAFVKSQVADIAGALHFKGVVTELPTTGKDGDVVILGDKEYVYASKAWHELGDENAYIVKGTKFANADIAANAAIEQSKIESTTGWITDGIANAESNATAAAQAKIEALDVAEKGGEGKYIATIKQVDGKIAATEGTLPTALKNPNALTVGEKAYDGSAAVTIAKGDLGLGSVDNTADKDKAVKSAGTLTTARTIAIDGAVTGTATSFDGSKNISINTTKVDATKLDLAGDDYLVLDCNWAWTK